MNNTHTYLNIHEMSPDNTIIEVADHGHFAVLVIEVGTTTMKLFAENVTDIAKVLTKASIALLSPADHREHATV